MVEVKSVTLASGGRRSVPRRRQRPRRPSLRRTGRALSRSGRPAAIVFVAQRGDIESVAPEDDVDPVFGIAIRRAAKAGVLVVACALEIDSGRRRARAEGAGVILSGSPGCR